MKPVVLLTSAGVQKADQIAKDILVSNGNVVDKPVTMSFGSAGFAAYLCDLKTKYYENTIALLPYEGDINALPEELLSATEMLIVYFEPDDKSFKSQLTEYCNFLTNNDIELGLLLTSKLYDDEKQGPTYGTLKENCKFQFDIIELCNDDDDGKTTGYKEVVEVLKNNIWSNIAVPGANTEELDGDLEEQLEGFENLIMSIQNFRRISSGMERDQRLDEAEKLADLFLKMMNEDK
ncbi:uncharacterized protein LOC105216880 [Zeugodacus cucurbitae]|uniref:uncharacterized protein LOC105216880 n=1 Tax=Zeugodacus cucurbitae TaxID=28588 RepID=UPI000596A61F|nr:uncharacterized protein LOC105216880 [Zeugodacus cucurbitae]